MYVEGIVESANGDTLDVTTERGQFRVVATRPKEVGSPVTLRVSAELVVRRRS